MRQWSAHTMKLGYFLSSEEWGPGELVSLAEKAQAARFDRLWISNHYHLWNDEQGHSPFVWSAIGAIARATQGIERHLEALREYEHAGFDELYMQQIGSEQDSFLSAYSEHVLPVFG